nr:anosmin-1-like isoform X1 [Paramormyrops kingsleyae]
MDGMSLLIVWCALGAAVARRPNAEDAEAREKIHSARCSSRCLALHITQLAAYFRHLQQTDDVLDWCEKHRRCFQCLQPCKELWEAKESPSPKGCEKHHECAASWAFLLSLQAHKQGDCPAPQRASGFAAACVESCSADRDCPAHRKCCPNDCGHTCQAPADLYKGVPLRPRQDMTFLEDSRGRLEVLWTSRFNVSMEPVLYVLQRRWNQGIHPSEDDATRWQTVAMTMGQRVALKDVRPHRWYQFRVSAVNSQGTRGFTAPSRHFLSSREPLPPATPRSLRKGAVRERPDGTVSVLLLWDPPEEEDLEVHHYKVSWRACGVRPSGRDRRESTRVTEGAMRELELQGLQPNSAYRAQVQAVAYWGQKRLRSGRSQLTFSTGPAAKSPIEGNKATGQATNELPSSNHAHSPSLRLEAAAPHYHSHQLQVKVFWRTLPSESGNEAATHLLRWHPDVCSHNVTRTEKAATVSGTHYVITDLLFGCKYKVAVVQLSGQRSEAVTSVMTPPCSTLAGDAVRSLQLRQECHLLAQKVLLRPEKLAATFWTVNGSLRGEFGWRWSQAGPDLGPISAVQFSLVQLSDAGTDIIPGALNAQTQNLASDQNSVTVESLKPESVYKVQIQVRSAGGSGPSLVKTIRTPQLDNIHI